MKFKKNLLLWNYYANLDQTLLKWSLGGSIYFKPESAQIWNKHNDELFNIYYGIFFKIVSVSAVLYPRWPPLLKIEISSNGQNCSILSQKVPKFELYKHNDELFNIYYGIFYELWTPRWPPLLKIEISSNGQKLLYFKPENWTV